MQIVFIKEVLCGCYKNEIVYLKRGWKKSLDLMEIAYIEIRDRIMYLHDFENKIIAELYHGDISLSTIQKENPGLFIQLSRTTVVAKILLDINAFKLDFGKYLKKYNWREHTAGIQLYLGKDIVVLKVSRRNWARYFDYHKKSLTSKIK